MNTKTKKVMLIVLALVGLVLLLVALPFGISQLGHTQEGTVAVPRNVEKLLEKNNLAFTFIPSDYKDFKTFGKETEKSPVRIHGDSNAEFVRWFEAGRGTKLSKAYTSKDARDYAGHYFVYWAPLLNGMGSVDYYEKIDFPPYPFSFASVKLKETPSAANAQILVSYTQKEYFRTLACVVGWLVIGIIVAIAMWRIRRNFDARLRALRAGPSPSAPTA